MSKGVDEGGKLFTKEEGDCGAFSFFLIGDAISPSHVLASLEGHKASRQNLDKEGHGAHLVSFARFSTCSIPI